MYKRQGININAVLIRILSRNNIHEVKAAYSTSFIGTHPILSLIHICADSLKKSADALNDSSLWEKKKIKKKDEKTGEEIAVEDYDLSLIHIWSFISKICHGI